MIEVTQMLKCCQQRKKWWSNGLNVGVIELTSWLFSIVFCWNKKNALCLLCTRILTKNKNNELNWVRMYCWKKRTTNCRGKGSLHCCCFEWGCVDKRLEWGEKKNCVAVALCEDVLTEEKNIEVLRERKFEDVLVKDKNDEVPRDRKLEHSYELLGKERLSRCCFDLRCYDDRVEWWIAGGKKVWIAVALREDSLKKDFMINCWSKEK